MTANASCLQAARQPNGQVPQKRTHAIVCAQPSPSAASKNTKQGLRVSTRIACAALIRLALQCNGKRTLGCRWQIGSAPTTSRAPQHNGKLQLPRHTVIANVLTTLCARQHSGKPRLLRVRLIAPAGTTRFAQIRSGRSLQRTVTVIVSARSIRLATSITNGSPRQRASITIAFAFLLRSALQRSGKLSPKRQHLTVCAWTTRRAPVHSGKAEQRLSSEIAAVIRSRLVRLPNTRRRHPPASQTAPARRIQRVLPISGSRRWRALTLIVNVPLLQRASRQNGGCARQQPHLIAFARHSLYVLPQSGKPLQLPRPATALALRTLCAVFSSGNSRHLGRIMIGSAATTQNAPPPSGRPGPRAHITTASVIISPHAYLACT